MFGCKLCHYTTDRSSNLKKHFETKKHIVNAYHESQKNNICTVPISSNHTSSKSCLQIENFKKNDQKKGGILLEKTQEFSSGVHKNDYVIDETIKFANSTTICDYNNKKTISNCHYNDQNDDDLEKNYVCEQCNKTYNCRQNLWRHKQTTICGALIAKKTQCVTTDNAIKIENNEIEELKRQVSEMSQIISNLTGIKNNQINSNHDNVTNLNSNNNLVQNNNTTNNISTNTYVLNYVNQTYPNAPVLKMLKDVKIKELLTIENSNHLIAEHIVFYYTKYKLPSFLGDIISNAYKKENPEEQEFWVTSVRYLTFIVRQLMNNKPIWKNNEKGEKIIENIINPMLKEVKKLLQDFITLVNDHKIIKTLEKYENLQNKGIIAVEIIKDINDNVLHNQILKYIVPHFQLRGEVELLDDEKKVVVQYKKPTKKKPLVIKNK